MTTSDFPVLPEWKRAPPSVWGEQDAVAAGQFDAREAVLRAVRPDLTFKLIPEAGHWASYENAPAFNAYLTEILR